jgi:serine/threonine protein kinase
LATFAGSGAEGEVYAAWWNDAMVAVKRFNRAQDSIHELSMHSVVVPHEGVVPLLAYCKREQQVYIVMEYFWRRALAPNNLPWMASCPCVLVSP